MTLAEEMVALEREADQLMFRDPPGFRKVAERMVALSRGAEPAVQARAYRTYGNALRMQGELQEGLVAVRRALRLWRQAGDEVEWARTQNAAVALHAQLGNIRSALAASKAGLAVFLRLEQPLPAARLLSNTGLLHLRTGKAAEALRCFSRARELARAAGDVALVERVDLNRAGALQALGRHQEALAACLAAFRPALRSKHPSRIAMILTAAAISLFQLGRFGKALERFARARDLFAAVPSVRHVADCDLHMAACYIELNRYEQALTRLRSMLDKPGQPWFERAWGCYYQGVALARLQRRDEALAALVQANRLFSRHGDRLWAARTGLEEAQLLLQQGDTAGAIRRAAQAARHAMAAEAEVDAARGSLLIADAALQAGQLVRARTAAAAASATFRRVKLLGLLQRSLALLGRVELRRRRYTAARPALTEAIRLAEEMRATVQLPFRRTFLADKAEAYADLVWLNLQEGKVAEAHRLADQAKSRALADQLSTLTLGTTSRAQPGDDRLLQELDAVRQEYRQLTLPAELGTRDLRSLPPRDPARRQWLEQRLLALWDEWELRQIRAAPGRLETAPLARTVRLDPGVAMVEYFVTQDRLIAFVSDHSGLRGWVELAPVEAVRRSAELLQLNLETALSLRQRGPLAALTHNARVLLQELHRLLWAPLLPWLQGIHHVVVIPHGLVHKLPLAALCDGKQYVVEQTELSLAPSREIWQRVRRRAREDPPVTVDLVLGYNPGDLPYIDDEAHTVAQTLGAQPCVDGEATWDRLLPDTSYRVVHLAVHGQFRPDRPDFSALCLAGGLVTAADLGALRLRASLVTLSGCETGLGRVAAGEELTGLINGFLSAGCATVIASLWRVDDAATAALMAHFYDNLMTGQGKAAALRSAQVHLIRRDMHPLYWAAFSIIGDTAPLQKAILERGSPHDHD